MDVVYHLWDKLILFNDNLISHFIVIAFLIKKKDEYINKDLSQIPSVLSQLTFTSVDEVDDVVIFAVDLMRNTPKSIRKLCDVLNVFEYKSSRLKEMLENCVFDDINAFPMLIGEFAKLMHHEVLCIDHQCYSFAPKVQFITDPMCPYCGVDYANVQIGENFFIFDLRNKRNDILSEKNYSIANEMDYENIYEICKKEIEVNINSHFIFIIDETEYYSEINTKCYKQKIKKREFINYRTHSHAKKFFVSKSKFQYINSQEYINEALSQIDKLKKLTLYLRNKNIPHVSYLYGGYCLYHDIISQNEIVLKDHDNTKCLLCKKNMKYIQKQNSIINSLKNLTEKKKNENPKYANVIDDGDFAKINDKIFKCEMKENINNENVITNVVVLMNAFAFAIYKQKGKEYFICDVIHDKQIKNVIHDNLNILIYYEITHNHNIQKRFISLNMRSEGNAKNMLINISHINHNNNHS